MAQDGHGLGDGGPIPGNVDGLAQGRSTFEVDSVSDAAEEIGVALNNTGSAGSATIPISANLANGAVLTDVLNGGTFTVTGGQIVAPVSARWGRILVAGGIDPVETTTPTATPTPTRTPTATGTPALLPQALLPQAFLPMAVR